MEVWLGTFPTPGRGAAIARMAEGDGWDGLAFTDSQNLSGDVFAGLSAAAEATTSLKLGTGATNPATRQPAVIASAIATIQAQSGGRAVLGIARGDSALAYLGRKPMPLAEFRLGLERIQTYLRGEAVELEGFQSRIEWLPSSGQPKVPMSVAATGPRVIELAAAVAERVTLSVGASIERLRECIAVARAVNPNVVCGAYVNAVAHPDVERARELVRGRLGVYARFSSMDRQVRSSLPEGDRAVAERLASGYDIKAHGITAARHSEALDDEFVDRFGIVGPSEFVAERLRELASLGLHHVIVVGHSRDVDETTFAESSRRFGREVLPRLRA